MDDVSRNGCFDPYPYRGERMESVNRGDFIDFLDDAMIQEDKDWEETSFGKKTHAAGEIGMLLGSKIAGGCVRENWYRWTGVEKSDPSDAKGLFVMKLGTDIGRMIGNAYGHLPDKLDVELERPIFLQPEGLRHPVKGKIDIILRFKVPYQGQENQVVIIECKSTHTRGITNKAFGVKYAGAKPDHIVQLAYYWQFADAPFGPYLFWLDKQIELSRGDERTVQYYEREKRKVASRPGTVNATQVAFMYVSREDFFRLKFVGGEDFQLPNINFACFVALEKYLEGGERYGMIPKRTYKKGLEEYPCSWCGHRTRCWKKDGIGGEEDGR